MTHPIISKLNDVEADLVRLPDNVSQDVCAEARGYIFAARAKLLDALAQKPSSTTQRQAAAQGDTDRGMYHPLREALARDGGENLSTEAA